jgi:hypothetical protein
MLKLCKVCNSSERYKKTSMCYTCLKEHNKERYKKTICVKCFNPKDITTSHYCLECYKNTSNKVKYKNMSSEFKVNLYLFVNNININKLEPIDAFVIAHYWAEIILFPHLYYNKDTYEQVKNMMRDLHEYLRGEKIKK